MQQPINSAALRLSLLLLAMTLSGCAVRQAPSAQVQIPAPPANLMTDDSADSLAYSQRVRDWLKKVADELSSWQQRKPGCNAIAPNSGACS